MTIDYQCSSCGKTLRVADEFQGQNAQCPECGNVQIIPPTSTNLAPLSPNPLDLQPDGFGNASFAPKGNPYSAPPSSQQEPPELTTSNVPIQNVVPELSEIFNFAFSVWKENILMLIAGALIFSGISFGFGIIQFAIQNMADAGVGDPTVMTILWIGSYVLGQVVQIFMGIGSTRFHLQVLRGGPADLGLLFKGADRFFSVLGLSIIAGLALLLGFLLLIIPGIILLLLFWPAYLLVVDRRTPVFESFSVAREITRGNVANTLMLAIIGFGIILIGFLACCIGMIAAQPLVTLLWGTAYLMMSGQLRPKHNQNIS